MVKWLSLLMCLLVACSGSDTEMDNPNANNSNNENNANNSNNANNQNNANNSNNVNNSNNANNTLPDMGTDLSTEDMGPIDMSSEFFSGPVNFFSLPIGSIRYAASMVVADEGFSVSLIWFGGEYPWCAEDFAEPATYAYIEPTLNPEAWDYSGNATYAEVEGCVNIDAEDPSMSTIDIKLDLTSEVWSGPLHFKAP